MKTNEIISKMTVEEKASLCSGLNSWETKSLKRLGVKSIFLADGPHGLRKMSNSNDPSLRGSEPATCFPTASSLSSSWNKELIDSIGRAIADEAKYYGVNILLGPGVNIKRTPLCGRNFEYYSEDPFLTSEMGINFINGVQSRGIGTSLKHFACNNQEYHRMSISVEINEQTLFETYLFAFKRIIQKANPWSVMCSYNRINGVHSSENKFLLKDILRKKWDFKGVVISDWGAVQDRVKSIKATLGLEMPGPSPFNDKIIIESIEKKELNSSDLDFCVENILSLEEKTKEKSNFASVNFEKNNKLAVEAASESIVLLKNENNILPLNKNFFKKIGIIGRFAKEPRIQGSGSSQVNPTLLNSPYDCIKNYIRDENKILYSGGYSDQDIIDETLLKEAEKIAAKSDCLLVFCGLPEYKEAEGYDRKDLELPQSHIELIKRISLINQKTIIILNNGSAITAMSWINDIPCLIEGWLSGQGFGNALTSIIFGDINPSGKLSETFPLKLEDTPSFLNYPGDNDRVYYGEGNYVGYKYYEKKKMEVLFPFGYGLSYSDFEYINICIDKKILKENEKMSIEVEVKNSSDVDGKEVIQVYVSPKNIKRELPKKELKGFSKILIKKNQSEKTKIELEYEDFKHYDMELKKWVVYPGKYEILVGSSSKEIYLQEEIELKSNISNKDLINKFSTLSEWLMIKEGETVINDYISTLKNDIDIRSFLNSLEEEFKRMVLEMPLRNVFSMFVKEEIISNDDIVTELLKRLKNIN